jgi:hypothetical protein
VIIAMVIGVVAAATNWWAVARGAALLEHIAKPAVTLCAIAVATLSGGDAAVVTLAVAALVISAMALLGWGTGNSAAAAGTALFVLSDTLLGWRRFVRRDGGDRRLAVAVMVTYHAAIFVLASSPGL